jgi:hypothetical protein
MKRPASGELVADSGTGTPSDNGSAATGFFALLIAASESVRRGLLWLATRAVARSVTPGSLAGVSVLFAVCAATWFSGGGREHGARGLLAMTTWLLFLMAARGLAAFKDRGPALQSASASNGAWPSEGGTDWLILPAAAWADKTPAGARSGGADESQGDLVETGALGFGWLAAVCGVAAECAIYGGMAAGIQQKQLFGAWPLAVLTVSLVAITDMLGACRSAALTAERRKRLGRNPVLRAVGALLRIPPALRGMIAFAGYAVSGPQIALLAICGLGAIAIAAAIATLATVVPSVHGAGAAPARRAPPKPSTDSSTSKPARGSATITAVVGVSGSPGETTSVRYTTTPSPTWTAASSKKGTPRRLADPARAAADPTGATADPAGSPASAARAASPAGADAAQGDFAAGPTQDGAAMILALRDDGAAARWAGGLVQGNLIPVPPALAGLIATALLAALGLRHLPSFIALTPPVVMMLAAPGSSHPHDSRFDWLVPVLLVAAQFVYMGPLGFSLALPGPIIFSACAVLAIWYASNTAIVTGSAAAAGAAGGLGFGAQGDGPGHRLGSLPESGPVSWVGWGAGLGWETRMFVIGLGATFGLATFGYLGLAAYLGVLICREVMTGYLVLREEDRH